MSNLEQDLATSFATFARGRKNPRFNPRTSGIVGADNDRFSAQTLGPGAAV